MPGTVATGFTGRLSRMKAAASGSSAISVTVPTPFQSGLRADGLAAKCAAANPFSRRNRILAQGSRPSLSIALARLNG
jgi:hypothetical protein